MTEEAKKQRKPSYTVSKWAEENGYTDAMLALLGDDAKKIMPAVKAGQREDELRLRVTSLREKADELEFEAQGLADEAYVIHSIKARLDAIKKAATGE